MAKLSAWLVTLIGVLWIADVANVWGSVADGVSGWIVALAFLVMGIGKLMRNYGKKR